MPLPVLVNTIPLSPDGAFPSAQGAGMVPIPSNLLAVDMGDVNPSGIGLADTSGGFTSPNSTGFSNGGICFDGTNAWTGQMSGSPAFSQFTKWDDSTLLPITSVDIASSAGNGNVPCDVALWNGKVWMLANTTGVNPPQLVANDLSTTPLRPSAPINDFSHLLSANGHLYYFDTENSTTIFLVVDGVTIIPTSLPVSGSPDPYLGVAGTAWDGTHIWVTIPSANQIAKLLPDGTIVAQYTVNVPVSCNAVAIDFNGNVWVGNRSNGAGALSIELAVFDLNGNLQTSFSYGFNQPGIGNIVSDSNTQSVWVTYYTGVVPPTHQIDQYQYPATPPPPPQRAIIIDPNRLFFQPLPFCFEETCRIFV